jgi:transcriptional regulator with XRE-family HTH domain
VASPTARRKLGIALKQLREQSGLNLEQASKAVGISDSHLSRLERGRVGVRQPTLRALLQNYAATPDVADELLQIAADTTKRNTKDWWQPLAASISEPYATLISFEHEATSVKVFGPTAVPGLLQTEAYARALLQNGLARLGPDEIEIRISARRGRQAILDRPNPPAAWFILDEAVLHRQVGSTEIMHEQLTHLVEIAQRPRVDIQIIPYSAGAHAGTLGPLVLLGFAEGDDVIYCETYAGGLYPDSVAWYGDLFDRLAQEALSKSGSLDILRSTAEELG